MLHRWVCVHTYDVSTYSVSSDRVSDSSSELRCLSSPYLLCVWTLTIRTSMQHANAMLKKGWPERKSCLSCIFYASSSFVTVPDHSITCERGFSVLHTHSVSIVTVDSENYALDCRWRSHTEHILKRDQIAPSDLSVLSSARYLLYRVLFGIRTM